MKDLRRDRPWQADDLAPILEEWLHAYTGSLDSLGGTDTDDGRQGIIRGTTTSSAQSFYAVVSGRSTILRRYSSRRKAAAKSRTTSWAAAAAASASQGAPKFKAQNRKLAAEAANAAFTDPYGPPTVKVDERAATDDSDCQTVRLGVAQDDDDDEAPQAAKVATAVPPVPKPPAGPPPPWLQADWSTWNASVDWQQPQDWQEAPAPEWKSRRVEQWQSPAESRPPWRSEAAASAHPAPAAPGSLESLWQKVAELIDTASLMQLQCLYHHSDGGRQSAMRITCALQQT